MHDFRYSCRALARSKGFTAVAVLTLAVALGLNTTMFAVLEAALHPSVPYRDVDRLFRIVAWGEPRAGQLRAWDRYQRIRDGTQFYEEIGWFAWTIAEVRAGSIEGSMEAVVTASPNFFSMLGVTPAVGRVWNPAHGEGEAEAGVVVSSEFRRRAFAGGPSLHNATVVVGDRAYPVIGVLPSYPAGPPFGASVWRVERASDARWLVPVVRLKPGLSADAVAPELGQVAARLAADYGPTVHRPFSFRMFSMRPDPLRLSEFHGALAGGAFLVLVIACANLANLMSVRGLARGRELSLRKALGAKPSVLVREQLAEATVLAIAGAALGLLFAWWAVEAADAGLPSSAREMGIVAPRLDWRVLAATLAATGLTIIAFGPYPSDSGITSGSRRAPQAVVGDSYPTVPPPL